MENPVSNPGANSLLPMGKVPDTDRLWKNYSHPDTKLLLEYHKISVDESLHYKGKSVNWDLRICLPEVPLPYEYPQQPDISNHRTDDWRGITQKD